MKAYALVKAYFAKMRGQGKGPPLVSLWEVFWSWLGALLGIGLVAYLDVQFVDKFSLMFLIGSFGASAVLLYGAPRSPLAQPRNVLGGHVISALAGISVRLALAGISEHLAVPYPGWICAALAVACAIALMHLTGTLHPPGGATALIAVTGGPKVDALGYLFAIIPVGAGAIVLILVALFVNNLAKNRRYPEYWW
jgi:CBS-domain-containing membrane protein